MEWTRSPWMRTTALVASLALVLMNTDDRGTWFWVGVVLLALNVIGVLAGRRGPDVHGLVPPGDRATEESRSHRLADWLTHPGVSAAFAQGPALWDQVSHLDDGRLEPTAVEEIAEFVWLEHRGSWAIELGDEVKPYLDLDMEEAKDPVLRVLAAHPAVERAHHQDREVYGIEHRRPIPTDEMAVLAARALVAHHVEAASAR